MQKHTRRAIILVATGRSTLPDPEVVEAGAPLVELPSPAVVVEGGGVISELVVTDEVVVLSVVVVKFFNFSAPAVIGTGIAWGKALPVRFAVLTPGLSTLLPVAVPTQRAWVVPDSLQSTI